MKRLIKLLCCAFAVLALTVAVTGCAQKEDEGPAYVDQEAIEAMAQGLENRFDKTDAPDAPETTPEVLDSYIDEELNQLNQYKDGPFENSKMQELYLSYINTLEEMKTITPLLASDTAAFYQKWEPLYDKRCDILKQFVDDYDLTVEDKYSQILKELVANGQVAQENTAKEDAAEALVSAMSFEKTSDGYGWYTYSCVVENTTDYDYSSFSVTLGLYDKDGVKQDDTYAITSNWAKGEKVKFEATSSTDAETIKVTLDFYTVE